MSDSWARPYESVLPNDMIVMPVKAYRIWYVPIDQYEIRSWWMPVLWEPCKRVEAECRNHLTCVCSEEPFWAELKREWEGSTECTCNAGIYGWKTFDQAFEFYIDKLEDMHGLDSPEPTVNRIAFGTVNLWGKVIECERGFRGQYAYPSGIFYTADNSRSIASLYRVPLLAIKNNNRYPESLLCP
jgi:hypothetical protein